MLKALHWLRSRQEERELAYWFALVFYDHRDRSFNNRAYFFYLVLFFAVWFFMLLIFIAGGGVQLLEMLVPGQPQRAAVICTVVLLALWFIVSLRTSLKRSPLILSEEDAHLLCQTPLQRGMLVLRWVWMPWFKNAIPIWLATIVLGFSLAEIFLPGDAAVDNLPVYLGYGLRAWVCVLPIHLGLFAFQWLAGISRLQKDIVRRWLHLPFLGGALVFFYMLLNSLMETTLPLPHALRSIFNTLAFPLRSGFGQGSLLSPVIVGLVFALGMLALLYLAARNFNLTRAAQETQTLNLVQDLQRYGFTDSAKQIQQQQRLGAGRKTVHLPAYPGSAALLWKDILQSRRSLRLPDIFNWFMLFGFILAFALLPNLNSRALVLVLWTLQIGKFSVVRLRDDLAHWVLVRQLPFSRKQLLLMNLGLTYLLQTAISLAGLLVAAVLFAAPVGSWVLLLPAIVAVISLFSGFDVIRHSRSSLLLNGNVPQISAVGIILGMVCAAIPVLLATFIAGPVGLLYAVSSGILLAMLAYSMVVQSFSNIDNG